MVMHVLGWVGVRASALHSSLWGAMFHGNFWTQFFLFPDNKLPCFPFRHEQNVSRKRKPNGPSQVEQFIIRLLITLLVSGTS